MIKLEAMYRVLPLALLVLIARAGAAQSPSFETLYSFKGLPGDGASPSAVLIVSGGGLVGTTEFGGIGCAPFGCGTVFSLAPPAPGSSEWSEQVIYQFSGVDGDGANPAAELVSGPGGVLYGTTAGGGANNCGTVFALTPPATPGGAWTETILYSFAGPPGDGSNPITGVILGRGGALYGTTQNGGTSNGTVFSLEPPKLPGAPWTETILHIFAGGADGAFPFGGLVFGGGGVIYGDTQYGGSPRSQGFGTVYELTLPTSSGGTWSYAVLYSFGAQSYDGEYPHGKLIIGLGGVLYGTTDGGGTSSAGTVFSLTPPASSGGPWTETSIYALTGASFPAYPQAGLALGKSGALYGTTSGGGILNWGTVFALKPPTVPGGLWTEVTLHNFRGGKDGSDPIASLTVTPNGELFGTTFQGGTSNFGTVFSLKP